jgi:hypothetical protein
MSFCRSDADRGARTGSHSWFVIPSAVLWREESAFSVTVTASASPVDPGRPDRAL